MSFAKWDSGRKGTGAVLSGGDLTVAITGLYMVAASNAVDISGSTGYYAEFTGISTIANTFMGVGPAKSDSTTDTYLGAYANQYCMWQDATDDTVSGVTRTGNLWNYASSRTAGIKIAVKGNKLWIGKIGTGWRNPNADNFTADPTAGTNYILSGFAAGLWSLAVSCITAKTESITANFGASSFVDTPPSGFVGWPGAGGTVVNLSGVAATCSAGTLVPRQKLNLSGVAGTAAPGSFLPKQRLAVSGVSASAAVGTLAPRIKPALLGAAATCAVGVLVPISYLTLSGISATSGLGTLAPQVSAFLTGLAATGMVGELEPPGSTIVNLTGVAAAGGVGSLAPRVSVTLAGVQGAGAVGTLAPRTYLGLTGIVAAPSVGAFVVSVWPTLNGIQASGEAGSFDMTHVDPKLVSITITNVGLAAMTTITSIGSRATTTITNID